MTTMTTQPTTGISCGHCRGRHPSVAAVRECASRTVTAPRRIDRNARVVHATEAGGFPIIPIGIVSTVSQYISRDHGQGHELHGAFTPICVRDHGDGRNWFELESLLDENVAARKLAEHNLTVHAQVSMAKTERHVDWFEAVGSKPAPSIYRDQTSDLDGVARTAPEPNPWDVECARPVSPVQRATATDVQRAARECLPDVPKARYAVRNEGGEWRFYRVDRPQSGAHKGKVFVKVQASDDLHNLRYAEAVRVIREIGQDVKAAVLAYGREIGRCSACNRTLTNATSIADGMGPICSGRFGL